MASIDFPSGPTVGQMFTAGNRSWVWTGTTWDVAKETSVGSTNLFLLMGA
jgi:hypothetical protein